MAVYAEHQCFAFSCYHQFFPGLRTFLDIRQFSYVMDFEVSPFPFAVFTCVGAHSSQKFASACVLKGEWGIIHLGIEDGFSFHVFWSEELKFPDLSFSSRFTYSSV